MATIDGRSLSELRRDLHQYPEAGWREFRTTALVAEALEERGYELSIGSDAVDPEERLGVPEADEIQRARERAIDAGAPEEYVERMGTVTGLVAEKTFGDGEPVVGVRVDMDALEITESGDADHRPQRDGFASRHPGEMHACGHDGHTSIGVGVARRLDSDSDFTGTVKLFFQPAEEGGRGGLSMSETDHLADIDHILGIHLGLGNGTGKIIAGYDQPLPNAKLDVEFRGASAHAGQAPNEGRNALQAATAAIQNLYAIPRHEEGATRINVGSVESPNVHNVISDLARMRLEVRGGAPELSEYMLDSAERIVEHAAGMHDVEYETSLYGKTTTFEADEGIVSTVAEAARSVGSVTDVVEREPMTASEDVSYLIRRVQEEGGEGTFVCIGTDHPSGHHTPRFDIDEESIEIGVDVVVGTLEAIASD
ncbi:amidohydrolase [Natronomonas sp. F2-12]|uniref:Amidohydrolase n=1 Tax=Natronomonas aquatica TaxID=2841590 RepID=A0A9R1CSE6_9EURY|nr:amidohydrolase [Natronomonas aquatica]MCQ4332973.1 amidohydrolase [Natronomonas aquatica]